MNSSGLSEKVGLAERYADSEDTLSAGKNSPFSGAGGNIPQRICLHSLCLTSKDLCFCSFLSMLQRIKRWYALQKQVRLLRVG